MAFSVSKTYSANAWNNRFAYHLKEVSLGDARNPRSIKEDDANRRFVTNEAWQVLVEADRSDHIM